MKIGQEAVLLAGVEFDGAEHIGEMEAIDDDTGLVRKCARSDNIHAPRRKSAGHIGEKAGAIARDDCEIEELAVGAKVELDLVLFEAEGHVEMVADLFGETGLQIALRQAFKKLSQRLVLCGGNHGAEPVQ